MRIYKFQNITQETWEFFTLKNCSVVIDGQNYLHNIYEQSKIPYLFGCEADKYAQCLRQHFEMFKKANVKCYIIFKGGDTDMEKKINKNQHLIFDVKRTTEYISPMLLNDASVEIIDEMGIDYTFCVAESKDECVALAQKLQCPVMSRDNEFCFRNTPYIPYPTLKFNREYNTIHCRIYKLQNFLQKYSLTEEKLAIFATLTDTTVFPPDYFDTLFKRWWIFNKYQEALLKNLIVWLSKHSEEETRKEISRILLNDRDRIKFWSNYDLMLNNMRKQDFGHVTEYLLNSNVPIVRQDPEWFEKGVVCKHVKQVYVNLYKSKAIEGSWLILDKQADDCLLLSIDIVKYAYNLLTNFKRATIKVYKDPENFITVDSDDPNVRRPKYECVVSVFENGWDEVKNLRLFEHFLTESNMNIEVLANAELPEDCVTFLIALAYFARKKQLKEVDVSREVYAVLLSYIALNKALNISPEDYDNIRRVTKKYYDYDGVKAKLIFDAAVLNRFMELQFCIKHMNYLNVLCGSPFKSSKYSRLYNGTFIFNVFCDMRGKNCDDFVNELFQSTPRVLEIFSRIITVYRKLLI